MGTAALEEGRRPCTRCGALNPPAAPHCWQCQGSLRSPSGSALMVHAEVRSASGLRSGQAPTAQPSGPVGGKAKPWLFVSIAVLLLVAGGSWVLFRTKPISLPEQLDGSHRVVYQESVITSPFDQHPQVRLLEGGYGTDPAAAGSFGVSVWIMPSGQNGTTPVEILTLGLPAGVKVDVLGGVTASVDGADFECAASSTHATTMCAWSDGDVAGLIGTRERDPHKALAQVERIQREIGA